MNILIVGDIFSKLGRTTFERNLKALREQHKINFIIVNGENTSHGKGLNEGHYHWYMQQGVNVITLGNHSFQNRSIFNFIDNVNNIVRPANLEGEYPGVGYVTVNYNNLKLTVIQVLGTIFMNTPTTSPYQAIDEILAKTQSDIYLLDIHAETTSEKIALGYNYDGIIDVIFGTHTHVQTNDARILPKGSAYITDVGMTGSYDGVIGVKKEIIIDRQKNNAQHIFDPEEKGQTQFSSILIEINDITHKVAKIDTIHVIE